ncbi:phospholipase D A isoform X2 [Drosophila willistoni]|uniref:phospholipase D A isoform X2 n=1 Tax=Drosophila willistoni TaxID=7260 RepID=UPI000C26C199|nr:phospholipase D A isoform X2 [Drosophila willistoni]
MMDPRRGAARQNANAASKTSVAQSRHVHHQPTAAATNVGHKFGGSEVSLSPSQAKKDVENPRKSPLDALSRGSNLRQDPFERRSGLQDVDEAFLSNNAFARPSRVRHSGLEIGMANATMPQPGGGVGAAAPPTMTTMRMPGGQEQQQQQQPPLQQSIPPMNAVPSQHQQQQPQYVQPPAAGQPTRLEPAPTGRAHVHQQAAYEQQQQQQQMQQQQQQMQQQQQQQQQMQQQQQQQQQQEAMYAQQQQQAAAQSQQAQQQQGYPAQQPIGGGTTNANQNAAAAAASGNNGGAGGAAPPPDAEMCTTCPNCQTTIYLVRSPELGHGDAGSPVQ